MKKEYKTLTIDMARELAPTLGSRLIIDRLSDVIHQHKNKFIVLNFKNVEFISRSAADELIMMKEKSHFLDKQEISITNANKIVEAMLRTVAASRITPKKKPEFLAKKVTLESLLKRAK